MRNFCHYIFICSVFMLFLFKVNGQDGKKISGSYEGYVFSRLVSDIESSSAYHFFYDPSETDSLLISVSVKEVTIPELLEQVFAKTNFHYAIDADGRIFVSRNFAIHTELPANFFTKKKPGNTSLQPEFADDLQLPEKGKLKISADNKLMEVGDRTVKPGQG
ncbi:MAG TPA: STN domain-containing protein, partial [Puia sp.]|nr:STN domain-containing protein [Puia sp.]